MAVISKPRLLKDFSIECIVCFGDFDSRVRRPVTGSCGHSLCRLCAQRITYKCPHCCLPGAFSKTVSNVFLQDILRRKRQSLHAKSNNKSAREIPEFRCKCSKEFDHNDCRPLIGTCGHTICSSCFEQQEDCLCPICEQMTFSYPAKNFALLSLIEDKQPLANGTRKRSIDELMRNKIKKSREVQEQEKTVSSDCIFGFILCITLLFAIVMIFC